MKTESSRMTEFLVAKVTMTSALMVMDYVIAFLHLFKTAFSEILVCSRYFCEGYTHKVIKLGFVFKWK